MEVLPARHRRWDPQLVGAQRSAATYEWGSFRPTFGLIGWDPRTFERLPKPSLAWLGEVARTGRR